MLRLLADENFSGNIVRGVIFRQTDIDIVRVQGVGLRGADDAHVLAWAGENGRIVLTHDDGIPCVSTSRGGKITCRECL